MNKTSTEKGADPLFLLAQINQMKTNAEQRVQKVDKNGSVKAPNSAQLQNGNSKLGGSKGNGNSQKQIREKIDNIEEYKAQSISNKQRLFGEPPRIHSAYTERSYGSEGLGKMQIQENYMDRQASYKNMNQALLSNKSTLYKMEPNEKLVSCFDVRREGGISASSNNSQSVLGRFIVTNYRLRFIENGKRGDPPDNYHACSLPFGNILKVM